MSKHEFVVWEIVFILILVFGVWLISNNVCLSPDGCLRGCKQGDDHLAAWVYVVTGVIGIAATAWGAVVEHREK